jgi:hypothetical protein
MGEDDSMAEERTRRIEDVVQVLVDLGFEKMPVTQGGASSPFYRHPESECLVSIPNANSNANIQPILYRAIKGATENFGIIAQDDFDALLTNMDRTRALPQGAKRGIGVRADIHCVQAAVDVAGGSVDISTMQTAIDAYLVRAALHGWKLG